MKQRKAQETRDLLEALSEKVEELAMEVEQAAIGDTAGCDTPKLSEVHRRVDDIHERLKRWARSHRRLILTSYLLRLFRKKSEVRD